MTISNKWNINLYNSSIIVVMFISPTNSKRFNIYHLEEKEIYIQDFYGTCSFFDLNTHEERTNDKGKFYLCSKSIIYESDNRNIPLMKYRFETFIGLPSYCIFSIYLANNVMRLTINRLTTIRVSGSNPPEPFKIIEDIK